jgi:hypothetical protein
MGVPARELEESLQERIERLEAGEPVVACLADLPEDEADLLRLVTGLGEMQYPPRERDIVAAQRAQLLKLAARERDRKDRVRQQARQAPAHPFPNWLRMLVAFSGASVILCVCVLTLAVGAGMAWWSTRDRAALNPSPLPGSTQEAGLARGSNPEPTLESASEVPDPYTAVLAGARGFVQVRDGDGTWVAVSAGNTVVAGQHVRTGGLSSVELVFYDGSRAVLGPHTEVSIDELDARLSGGRRVVSLTQWVGETDHDVVALDGVNTRYKVRTPSATGEAQGTSFHVLVTPDLLTRFSVDEGSVAVTNVDVTVVVVAGQSTTVDAGHAPGEPVFRITGEGRVTQTGATWTIAGQAFATHGATVIVGNPQVGDWVLVEGRLLPDNTRVADLILLLRRAPANRFTITGRVVAIGDTAWMVAGQTIVVSDETDVEDDIEIDDLVRVEGVILEGGTLLAERIHRIEEEPGLPFSFVGVVQTIADETWTISGITITVDAETEIDEGLASGDIVQVRGWILDDESWLARSIERVEDEEREFELTGYVESIAPWVVAGIHFETSDWTEIEAGIQVGDRVRVTGRVLEDGTWMAAEIERLDDDEMTPVVFVGMVTSIDPWVVSGISLTVNDETAIEGDVSVGDLVKVEARVLPDGTWLATKITPVDRWGLGCVRISAVVVRVGTDQIELLGGLTIPIDGDVAVVGELAVNSIVVIIVCVDADGTVHVLSIIVIWQPAPVLLTPTATLTPTVTLTPTATSPPPTPTSPPPSPAPRGGDKVTICHKPNSKNPRTITISRSALQAHLDHGDTIGPCP